MIHHLRVGTLASGALLLALAGVMTPACGTDAQGVDSCRRIEQERCRQAVACGDLGIHTDDEVEACVRFYRDQCLHGFEVPDVGGPQVTRCVSTIQSAGSCALSKKPFAECNIKPAASTAISATTTACEFVIFPERAADCEFLAPLPALVDAGSETTPDAVAE